MILPFYTRSSSHKRVCSYTNRNNGYSLVELMIAIVVGSILMAAVTYVYITNSGVRSNLEKQYRLNDNGLQGLQFLADGLRNAGFYGDFDPGFLQTPSALPNVCAATLAAWREALPVPVQGQDKVTVSPDCIDDVRAGTDIVVARQVAPCATGSPDCNPVTAGSAYLQQSRCNTANELSSHDRSKHYRFDTDYTAMVLKNRDCSAPAPVYQYRTHIYFVANNDRPGDSIPTLKRAELMGGQYTTVSIAQGVENLQIEYGVDSGQLTGAAATGVPGGYLADPGRYNSCTGKTCVDNWRNTVSAKIHLLLRSQTPVLGHLDSSSYDMGLNADGTPNVVSAPNDGFKRQVFSTTVRLNNIAGRNTP